MYGIGILEFINFAFQMVAIGSGWLIALRWNSSPKFQIVYNCSVFIGPQPE